MNIEHKIIETFHQVVNDNYEALKNEFIHSQDAKAALKMILHRVTIAPERIYPIGLIKFHTPQVAIVTLNEYKPLYYMDKLIILASFAKCFNYEPFLMITKAVPEIPNISPAKPSVTFLLVKHLLTNESIFLCPGLPFNNRPQ